MAFITPWLVYLMLLHVCKEGQGTQCDGKHSNEREMSVNIKSARNTTGEWVSTFVAKREMKKNKLDFDVDLTFKVSECEENEIITVRGILTDTTGRESYEKLTFHPNCGTNVAIVNNGRTIVKLSNDEKLNGMAVTNRPLKNNELFEVRLDKKISKWNEGMVMGVITHDPNTLKIPRNIGQLTNGTWCVSLENVYINGNPVKSAYIPHLKNQKVGDRLGVKRTEFGTLHVYINGVDQGPAASRVPGNVYGFYEVRNEASEATIVDYY